MSISRDVGAILGDVSTKSDITTLTKRLKSAEKRAARADKRAQRAERELEDVRSVRKYRALRAPTSLLAASFTPDVPVPSPAQVLQGQQNASARWELLQEFGGLSSTDIADLRSRAKNRHALASRWHREGKVFSVDHHGQRVFPGFQFDLETLTPRQVVGAVLAALPLDAMTDWEVALWWTADNGWLDGRRPVDLILEDPERLVDAATQLAEPSPL